MQTELLEHYKQSAEGREADAILRSCVHCGFCTATCPTYQLLGDELDGPRGRIYLIKQVFEGHAPTRRTLSHLDRCLTCRACETTCPSGVRYGRLADIGRHVVEQAVTRPASERWLRRTLRAVIPHRRRFAALLALGRLVRPLLPAAMRAKIPPAQRAAAWPQTRQARRMLVLDGCVQPSAAPATNAAAARVLDRLGIQLLRSPGAGCCGALSHHLAAGEEALNFMRRNIDAWWPQVEAGVEAIVMTASGCGVLVKDYGELLAHDPVYADKARRVSALTRDLSEVLAQEDLSSLRRIDMQGSTVRKTACKVAFHAPCTLQHGQRVTGVIEGILTAAGHTLVPVADAHLCCGSAGTYSILQPALSQQLLRNKLTSLNTNAPDVIATANIGCQLHLATQATVPVRHWIELLDSPPASD